MRWNGESLELIDQTKLPVEVKFEQCKNYIQVAEAIKGMVVRGAPAIGITAAYGIVLAAKEAIQMDSRSFYAHMEKAIQELGSTRPTAVNLFWAIKKMQAKLDQCKGQANSEIVKELEREAQAIHKDDLRMNENIGSYGNELVPHQARILTHCNAGGLATAGYGTALGVIRAAHEASKEIKVWVDETRPLLQGSRLTAFELHQDKIDATLIADNMAGYIMQQGLVDLIVVGADRIAANGDVANKIGTYSLAVLAKEHDIPFYVAAPTSTIDMELESGKYIPIEERDKDEVRFVYEQQIAPKEIKVYNPAFDVTPNNLITAIITEKGVCRAPYTDTLGKLFEE